MLVLLLGIIVFLGGHTLSSLRETRTDLIGRFGENGYKALYSIISLAGFVLIVVGFRQYRADGWVQIWNPPVWTRHITILLMWFSWICIAAMGKRPSRIRGWLRHPMLVAIKLWALAHLLANGDAGGMLLFGSFLAWAVYDRISVKRRGDPGAVRIDHFTRADAVFVVLGTVLYAAMIALHPYLIGVPVVAM